MSVPLYSNDAPIADPGGVSTEEIAQATAFAAKPAETGKRVNVVSPDGETYSLPEEQVAGAVAQGYKPETPEQKSIRSYLGEHRGLGGDVDVAMEKFADWATFGAGSALFDSMRDPLARAQAEALAKDHAVASAIGGGLGFGASLLYGGEFFDAASAAGSLTEKAVGNALAKFAPAATEGIAEAGTGLARKMIASGAKYGVESAVLAAPRAVTEAALGEPDQAAETLLYALGGGAVLGLAGPLVSKVGSAIKSGLASSTETALGEGTIGEHLKAFSDKEAIKAFNPTAKFSKKIDGVGESEVADVIRKYKLRPTFGETAEVVSEDTDTARKAVGEQLGQLVEQASGRSARISGEELTNILAKVETEWTQGSKSIGAGPIRTKLRQLSTDAVDAFPTGASLDDLVNIRRQVDDITPFGEKSKALSSALGDLRSALENKFYERVESDMGEAGTDLLAKYRELKKDYRALVPLAEAAKENISRSISNRSNSITDYAGNMIGGFVGHAIGGPVGAVVGSAVGGYANRVGRLYGNAYISRGIDAAVEWSEGKAGLLGIEQAMKGAADQIDRIPGALESMSKSSAATTAVPHLVAEFAGEKADHFNELAGRLTDLASDPAHMQQKLAEMVTPFQKDAPNISAALATKASIAIGYLASTLPKDPNPPQLFGKSEWRPSDQQLQDFSRRLQVIDNPFVTIDRLKNRTLGKADVETLRAVYPEMYKRMQEKVIETAMMKPMGMPYADKLQLAQLFGAPLDRSMTPQAIASYQQGFVQSGSSSKPPLSTHRKSNMPSLGTDVQRLSGG